MSEYVWVFGYGSLVSPASLARTIGRTVIRGVDAHVAEIHGFARRWNYGSMTFVGDWTLEGGRRVTAGTIVALGLVGAAQERTNGVIVRMNASELAALDARERNYDRVDVTGATTVEQPGDHPAHESIMTYVPRASSIERYESARDAGTAAVRRSYWELVDEAFVDLGGDHAERYRATTPSPDIPVVDMVDVREHR